MIDFGQVSATAGRVRMIRQGVRLLSTRDRLRLRKEIWVCPRRITRSSRGRWLVPEPGMFKDFANDRCLSDLCDDAQSSSTPRAFERIDSVNFEHQICPRRLEWHPCRLRERWESKLHFARRHDKMAILRIRSEHSKIANLVLSGWGDECRQLRTRTHW